MNIDRQKGKGAKEEVGGSRNYVGKIEHLLAGINDGVPDECRLVALVVLVNHNLVDQQSFRSVWLEQCQSLQKFCSRLLKQDVQASEQNPSFSVNYARLVVLLLERILAVDEEAGKESPTQKNPLDSSTSFLMTILLNFLSKLQKQHTTDLRLTVQVLECLNDYFEWYVSKETQQQATFIFINDYLEALWECHFEAAETNTITIQDIENPSSDEDIMDATLHAVLQKIRDTQVDEKNSKNGKPITEAEVLQNWKKRLQSAMQDLYRNHVLRCFTLPDSDKMAPVTWSWWQQSLSSLSKERSEKSFDVAGKSAWKHSLCDLPKPLQQPWHETLLLYVRSIASHPSLPRFLKENPDIAPSVTRLFFIHLFSPSGTDESDTLRLLAWTACAAWVERLQGYEWMLFVGAAPASPTPANADSGSKSLGSASQLCALIRLASGEWRIQLGYRLTLKEDGSQRDKSSLSSEEHRRGVVQAISQLLATLVSYLAQVAEDMEDSDSRARQSLSPEALLHLRDSLEDTLQATSNYLSQCAKTASKPQLDGEDSVIIQVLGSLLTEFDVFDAHANIDTDEVLIALGFAMSYCSDIRAQEQVIPSLTGIFNMSRDDSYRVLLLKEHHLVGNNMLSFLKQYFENSMSNSATTKLQSIPWACHLAELWFSILTENISELRIQIDPSPLASGIVRWIHHVLEETQRSSLPTSMDELMQALNAALGCYVTLHGQTPPNEHEGQILQRALQFCATHCQ